MRTSVILSAFLLVLGFALEILAEATLLAVPVGYLALLVVLAAVALLATNFLVSLLPGASERLKECTH
jgi:hypothetical protein